MKIIYKFDDGSTSEVEVDEELGAFISAEERKEENRQRSYKRKFIAYESFVYEGHEFGYEEDFLGLIVYENELDKVIKFIKTLTPTQARRFMYKYENSKISYREIARIEGTNEHSIRKSFIQIREKFKKFIK